MLEKTVKRRPANRFLGTRDDSQPGRPYRWKNFKEVYDLMDLFAKGKFDSKYLYYRYDTAQIVPWNWGRGGDVEILRHIRQE